MNGTEAGGVSADHAVCGAARRRGGGVPVQQRYGRDRQTELDVFHLARADRHGGLPSLHKAQRGAPEEPEADGGTDRNDALAKTHYKALTEAGVKIYEYTPGFVHAKVFVSDDIKAVVGTINLDYRSL